MRVNLRSARLTGTVAVGFVVHTVFRVNFRANFETRRQTNPIKTTSLIPTNKPNRRQLLSKLMSISSMLRRPGLAPANPCSDGAHPA